MTKTWERWTQKTKEFPKPKYGFTQLLKHTGDTLVTHPMSPGDAGRFHDAAKFWAYYHGKRIKTTWHRAPDDCYYLKVVLISHTRKRTFD